MVSGGSGITFRVTEVFTGLSTDTKPTLSAGTQALTIETDTGLRFYWDGAAWIPLNLGRYLSVGTLGGPLGADEVIVGVDTSFGPVIVTLPASAGAGRTIVVKDETGNASVNNITVRRAGADRIDVVNTEDVLNVDFQSTGYYSNGASFWFKI